jgi:diguanylate cyclase (GGDEF)-like protein
MKLAFLDLPDDRVDLISRARHDSNVEIVLVAHPDPDALALKIAEVLQIPRSHEPLDLLSLKPDRVALPSLASPSAAALIRAGISERIFVTLDDLARDWPATTAAPAGRPPEEIVHPIEAWESSYDEAAGAARLSRIRAALALSEDRQFLFSEVLSLAVEQARGDAGSIMVVDEEARELRIAFADGLSDEVVRTTRLPLGEGIAGKVAKEGTSLIINERVTHPRVRGERDRGRPVAAMSAPLQAEGRVIGVLNVSSMQPDAAFTEEHLARLNETAGQISGILDRTIRVARRDRDAMELRARREIEIAFGRKGLDLIERLRMVSGQLAELLGAESAQIHLADESLDRFRTISSSGRHGQEGELPLHHGLLARALAAPRPLFLFGRRSGRPESAEESEPNLLLAPLVATRPVGVLALECVAAAADGEEFERLSGRIASYLARSIEGQADESEQSRRSALLGSLADIAGRIMMTQDSESLLSEALGALRVLFPGGLVTARIRGDGGGFLFRSAFDGSERDHQRALELESTLARRAVESRRELASLGLPPEELRRVMAENGVSAYAFIPVRTDEEVSGVLGVLRAAPRREGETAPGLSRLDVQMLRKLTLYVSLAIANARRAVVRPGRTVEDPLTGLLAIGGFDTRVEEEVKRAERYRERFLLTVLAMAQFENLVDQNGSGWAESAQKEFAQALRRNVREVDAVARIGEGRFAVLSPASDKDGGAFLHRLESLLGQLPSIRSISHVGETHLSGRQYSFPDEIATGGELLALVRTAS